MPSDAAPLTKSANRIHRRHRITSRHVLTCCREQRKHPRVPVCIDGRSGCHNLEKVDRDLTVPKSGQYSEPGYAEMAHFEDLDDVVLGQYLIVFRSLLESGGHDQVWMDDLWRYVSTL